MTGPQHFDKAQSLLITAANFAEKTTSAEGEHLQDLKGSLTATLAAAQVHATLALAAATAAGATIGNERTPQTVDDAWGRAGAW